MGWLRNILFLATLVATGGGHAKYPPGQRPAPPQVTTTAASDGKRNRKKEKQRARRSSANPDQRPSSTPRSANVPAVSSAPTDEFLQQLERQHGKKQAKRTV